MGQIIKRRKSNEGAFEEVIDLVRNNGLIEIVLGKILFDSEGNIIGWGFENGMRRVCWTKAISYEEAVKKLEWWIDEDVEVIGAYREDIY